METTFEELLAKNMDFIYQTAESLNKISDEEASIRNRKWSRKEILGHLIDSACNNHGRFVRAQFSDGLVFLGYDQDAWVDAQEYQSEDWTFLIELWRDYNRHIIFLCSKIPYNTLSQTRIKHNLHQIAWRRVPQNEPATLEYFIRDYFGHMRHHVGQILGY